MNVLIVGLGGVTRTFRHWPERVLALGLARRGHMVWSIGTRDRERPALADRSDIIDGVLVRRVRSAYWPNAELSAALRAGPRPDIIHLMHPRNVLASQVTAWAKRQRIPTVYTWLGPFHDHYLTPDRDHPFEVTATYHRLIFERRQLWQRLLLERRPRDILRNYRLHWPLRAAVLLLPCSQFEADIMRQMGMTQPQVVVPLWVDVPWIEQMAHEPPVLDLPRPWLLFVGQLTRRKGYDLAIQALAEVLAVLPQASLLIVSGLNEAQREDGLRLARELGVERHVHMLGYCSDAELINLYRASDALLFPTRYEGFGLPLLEAMAAGCPIVTTDIPVVREIVQHHENGLLVPYNDAAALGQAVVELVQQPAWRERLIAGGRQTLQERYQEDALLLHIEDAYEQACDAKM